jgi:hypothetical protein
MQVTLRKADAIAKLALETARKLPLERSVTVSIYSTETVPDAVARVRATLVENLGESKALLDAAYAIRALISTANAETAVNALLGEKALADQTEKLLAPFVNSGSTAADPADTERQRQSLKARVEEGKGSGYGREEQVAAITTDAAFAKDVATQMLALRKQKVSIADRLTEINNWVKVALPASVVDTLTRHNVI